MGFSSSTIKTCIKQYASSLPLFYIPPASKRQQPPAGPFQGQYSEVRREFQFPEETMQKIKFDSFEFSKQAVQAANLNLKVGPSQACGILSALLSTINAKETLAVTCDYFAVFVRMADILMSGIFE